MEAVDSLRQMNEDYIGWLQIEGTPINYPVVQSGDNAFYLNHNFYKEPDFVGTVFMDFRNSIDKLDRSIILYGHNLKDERMFGSLKKYLNQDYYEEHKYISLDFLDTAFEWEIYSVYSSPTTSWMNLDFEDDNEYAAFLQETQEKSVITSNVKPTVDDQVITLATCTDSDTERFIVHAKMTN